LIFIGLVKDKKKPTKEATDKGTKMIAELKEKGIEILSFYWTLGRYTAVVIFEAPTEKEAMKLAFDVLDDVTMETMVAIPREEALKLL
jgi:uncharacterized protein with GYD domain